MRTLFLSTILAATAVPVVAQANPFRPAKLGIRGAQVTYNLTGDIAGSATLSMDPEHTVRRQTSTIKMMGKTTSTDSWTLTTEDSMYIADLAKAEGTVAPNILPFMAEAYDNLDRPGKRRLHENAKDMASILGRGVGMANLSEVGDRGGKKTYAGQECEERAFGGFTVCLMNHAPIALHAQGSLLCIRFEETATAVSLSPPGSDAFAKPAGVTWKPDPYLQNADSMATGYVLYLSSQQLSDSLAKAKAEMAQASAEGTPAAQRTPEQQAAMQQACEAIMNFNIGKTISDATAQMGKEIANALKRAAVDAAKDAATSKIKGLFKKPKIP